jgi:hypothetical protein
VYIVQYLYIVERQHLSPEGRPSSVMQKQAGSIGCSKRPAWQSVRKVAQNDGSFPRFHGIIIMTIVLKILVKNNEIRHNRLEAASSRGEPGSPRILENRHLALRPSNALSLSSSISRSGKCVMLGPVRRACCAVDEGNISPVEVSGEV